MWEVNEMFESGALRKCHLRIRYSRRETYLGTGGKGFEKIILDMLHLRSQYGGRLER